MSDLLADIPKNAEGVLIFGGTFDPPHLAHRDLPEQVREHLGMGWWLVYIPAARSPHKESGPIASNTERLEMLRAMTDGLTHTVVSDVEISRHTEKEPSYTVDTIETFRAERPKLTMRLLIGADQARAFHRWHRAQAVIELAEPVVMLRPPNEDAAVLLAAMQPYWNEYELAEWSTRIVTVDLQDTSATTVRKILQEQGARSPELDTVLPHPVREIIEKKGLYRPTLS
ncbi:MAG: nicotinate (nicotinamide) nucleotide adenylyltransferase [Planctomycetota bacterium]